MKLHEQVRCEGVVVSDQFLRVDGFLNHRIDPTFIEEAGRQLADHFADQSVSHVLTAEAAGNVIAFETARRLGACVVYAKKGHAVTMASPLSRDIVSPTKGTSVTLSLSAEYITPGSRVLIVDDFLYQGTTSAALAGMTQEAGGQVVGFGFVMAKEFAAGRSLLQSFDVPIVTLVSIRSLDAKTGAIDLVGPASS